MSYLTQINRNQIVKKDRYDILPFNKDVHYIKMFGFQTIINERGHIDKWIEIWKSNDGITYRVPVEWQYYN